MADLLNRTLDWIKANVAIAAGIGVAVVAILGVGGYFLLSGGGGKPAVPTTSSTGTALSPEQQAAIAQGVCGVAMQLVHDYGVLPQSAALATAAATEAGKPGFESCQAQSGMAQYTMVAEVTCDDLSNAKCVALDSVKGSDGTSLYRRRPYSEQPIPPPAPDTAPAPQPYAQPQETTPQP